MTLDELRAACEAAKSQSMDPEANPGFPLVLPRRAGMGRRMRVAPGLMGELLCENSDGRAVVRVTVADVERWLAKAERRARAAREPCAGCGTGVLANKLGGLCGDVSSDAGVVCPNRKEPTT